MNDQPAMPAAADSTSPRRSSPHPIYWAIAGALVAVAAMSILRPTTGPDWSQLALGQTSAGARGVFAFTGQLSKTNYGVFVVDVDAMTIWAYEYLPQKSCLRLAAARTWRYDRYLENFNSCDLPPDVVETMVEQQRQDRLKAIEDQMP
jgi:hypothetical protein